MKNRKSIIITHIVNPHHFYFKYLHECIGNEQFTKLDFEIQNYGNNLYSNQLFPNGYTPIEDDLVIFFHLMFNKWVRGKVIGAIGEKINLWCIDNGTFEKSTIQHILPSNSQFRANSNLVHLGGLSILPAEKTFNVHTTSIEMQPINVWSLELISIFKMISNNAKAVNFTTEFNVSDHTFGLLEVESCNGKIFNVNDKFLEMNKSMRADRIAEVISIYVGKFRVQDELSKSVDDAASSNRVNNNHSSSSSTIESKTTNNSTETANNLLSPFGVIKAKVSNWINQSEYDESSDSEDSASIIVSNLQQSISNGQDSSASVVHRNGETGLSTTPYNNTDLDYKCFFGTTSLIRSECNVRFPLPSTMNAIILQVQSHRSRISAENVSREDASCATSSIVNLNDNQNSTFDSTQSACSASSNESEAMRNKKILALLAANKNNTVEKSTGLNRILQKFNSNVDDKIVNKATSRINAIPAGYQMNALHTFGGLSKS